MFFVLSNTVVKSFIMFSELKEEIKNYKNYIQPQSQREKVTFTVYKSYIDRNAIIKGTKIEIDNDDKLQRRVCDIFPKDKNYIYIEVNPKKN